MKSSIKVVLIISLLLIASGIILAITNGKEKQKTTEEIIQILNDEYDNKFYPVIVEANEYETEIYTMLLEKYTSENASKYKDDTNKLKTYESLIHKITVNSQSLKKYCIGSKIDNENIESKCSAYIINYEQSINKYVDDVDRYNNNIKEYNNSITDRNDKLATYYTTIIQVDINSDGVFQKP